MNMVEGKIDGKGKKFALVASRFNEFTNEKLIEGARDCLVRHGVDDKDITLVRVPGAFELPFAAKKAASSGKFDAVICLGTIIRGETSHYEFLSSAVTKELSGIAVSSGIPIGYGVVTAENIEQAIARSGSKAGNRGWDAALTALEMVSLNQSKF